MNTNQALVRSAVAKGLLKYPPGQRFHKDGTPDPMLDLTTLSNPKRHSQAMFRQAYQLRQAGLSLHQVADRCNVPRGSIVYLIAQGHELHLADQRNR